MLRLVNDKQLMGRYINGRIFNILAWITVIILILLVIVLVLVSVFPGILS